LLESTEKDLASVSAEAKDDKQIDVFKEMTIVKMLN